MSKKKVNYKFSHRVKTNTLGQLKYIGGGYTIDLNVSRMYDFQNNYYQYMHNRINTSAIERSAIRRLIKVLEHEHLHKVLLDIGEHFNLTKVQRERGINTLIVLHLPYNHETIELCIKYTFSRMRTNDYNS